MFETFLLLCVRETIEKKLAEHTYYKDENRLFWQFIRNIQEILSTEELSEKKKIGKISKLL